MVVVEEMRRGKHPKDAGLEACRRIQHNTIEKRLLNDRGTPNFNVNFYVINAKGEYAGVENSKITVGMPVVVEGNDRLMPNQQVTVVKEIPAGG